MIFKKTVIFWGVGVFFLIWISAISLASDGQWEEPWSKDSAPLPGPENSRGPRGQSMAISFLKIYQKYISPVDGDRCPSYPSCSRYAQEVIQKNGVFIGFVMTFDRLLHEAGEIKQAPLIRVNESYRYYDPVENNDFWWNSQR
jgi:uncharacterized protein